MIIIKALCSKYKSGDLKPLIAAVIISMAVFIPGVIAFVTAGHLLGILIGLVFLSIVGIIELMIAYDIPKSVPGEISVWSDPREVFYSD